MTTIINNPSGGSGNDGGTGLIIGVLVAVVLVVLFFLYGLPAIRKNSGGENNVPENMNIDVNFK